MAQKLVGGSQLTEFPAGDVTIVVQLLQRKERAPGTQPGFRSAVDPLETLHQKFDVTDAAGVELYVDATRSATDDRATSFLDFFTRDERSLDSGKVELLGIDVRQDTADKLAREVSVACGMADLDERLQFPIVGNGSVIVQSLGEGDREFPFVALRAKTQVDAENGAFGRHARKDFGDLLGQADAVFAIRNGGVGRVGAVAEQIYE